MNSGSSKSCASLVLAASPWLGSIEMSMARLMRSFSSSVCSGLGQRGLLFGGFGQCGSGVRGGRGLAGSLGLFEGGESALLFFERDAERDLQVVVHAACARGSEVC